LLTVTDHDRELNLR